MMSVEVIPEVGAYAVEELAFWPDWGCADSDVKPKGFFPLTSKEDVAVVFLWLEGINGTVSGFSPILPSPSLLPEVILLGCKSMRIDSMTLRKPGDNSLSRRVKAADDDF